MSFTKFNLLLVLICCSQVLYGKVRVENVSDYNFGMMRPGHFPIKESTLWVLAEHYTFVIYGQSDTNLSFNLTNGVYKVAYTIAWKDNSGNFATILPNTMSPVFNGTNSGKAIPATMQMQIKGNFPKPGHYRDTLTLIITPA